MSSIFRDWVNGDFKSPPPSLLTLCYSSSTCSLSILSICKDAGPAGNYGDKVLNGILAWGCFYFYESLINQRFADSRRMTAIACWSWGIIAFTENCWKVKMLYALNLFELMKTFLLVNYCIDQLTTEGKELWLDWLCMIDVVITVI